MSKPRSSARTTDPLRKVSAICLTLPEATMETHDSHATFRVRKKVFAYFLDDHHGDGIVAVCVKTRLGENRDLAREHPEQFYLPAYIGPRGWVGIRLEGIATRWDQVADFIESSFCAVAPRTLATLVKSNGVPRKSGDLR